MYVFLGSIPSHFVGMTSYGWKRIGRIMQGCGLWLVLTCLMFASCLLEREPLSIPPPTAGVWATTLQTLHRPSRTYPLQVMQQHRADVCAGGPQVCGTPASRCSPGLSLQCLGRLS